jgi:hypothetical protein
MNTNDFIYSHLWLVAIVLFTLFVLCILGYVVAICWFINKKV